MRPIDADRLIQDILNDTVIDWDTAVYLVDKVNGMEQVGNTEQLESNESDLISRKALLKKLKEYVESVYECDFDDPQCTADGGSLNPKFVEGLWEAKEIIEDQPTAYDVDKVLEHLERAKDTHEDECGIDEFDFIDYEYALGIVKAGGKDV